MTPCLRHLNRAQETNKTVRQVPQIAHGRANQNKAKGTQTGTIHRDGGTGNAKEGRSLKTTQKRMPVPLQAMETPNAPAGDGGDAGKTKTNRPRLEGPKSDLLFCPMAPCPLRKER